MNADVVLSPLLLKEYDFKGKIVVVIDVLRATSTICTALASGARSVVPVLSLEEALSYKAKGYLAGAERDGEKVSGFDFGNSPLEYASDVVNGKDIVLTTTNGTRCIRMSEDADEVLVGSFLNLGVLCEHLKKSQKPVVLFCAGWKGKVNMEDSLYAGAVLDQIEASHASVNDSGEMMVSLYRCVKNELRSYLDHASHARRFRRLGIESDIDYCLRIDAMPVIPVLEGNKLVVYGT